MSSSEATFTSVYHGRVKWFNNKAGYGFITIIDGPSSNDKVGMDIFSHHSAISVSNEQYKYLVQGEYVEFTLSNIESSTDHKVQSSNIRGVNSGKLLCETRNENRSLNPRFRPRPRQQGASGTNFRSRNTRTTQKPESGDSSTQIDNTTVFESSARQENA